MHTTLFAYFIAQYTLSIINHKLSSHITPQSDMGADLYIYKSAPTTIVRYLLQQIPDMHQINASSMLQIIS